ncbi:hypothetical protein DFQ26_006179 [Actinomortierella ambigua]|nr:hypothetical protein DFQ26_006179 [Actinomortierella ambigua]
MSSTPAAPTASTTVSAAGLPTLAATELVSPMGLDPQDIPWLISLIIQGNVSLLDHRLLTNMNANVAVGPSYILHTFLHDNLVVAIKQYHQPKDVIHELHQLLVTPPNPFILKLHGIVQLGKRGLTCLATEYHPIGSLRQYIAGYRSQLSALHQMQIIHDIISGLECLHQRGTLHMNLHSANVLISHDGIALLTDFGKPNNRAEVGMPPKPTVEQERTRSLAAVFMAPEILASNSFSNLSEVYALGMIMFELLTGRVAFEKDLSSPGLVSRIMFGRQETIPVGIIGSPGLAYETLIKDCWTLEPEKRPHLSIVKARLEEMMEQNRAQQRAQQDFATEQFTHQQQQQQQQQPQQTSESTVSQFYSQQPLQQPHPTQQHQIAYSTTLSQPAPNVYTKVVVTSNTGRSSLTPASASMQGEPKEDRSPVETWTIGFTPATVAMDRDALPLGTTPPKNQALPAGTAASHAVSYVIAPSTAAPFDPSPPIASNSNLTESPASSPTPSLQRQPSGHSSANVTTYTSYSEPSTLFDGEYPSTAFSTLNKSTHQAESPKNGILPHQQGFQLSAQPLPDLKLSPKLQPQQGQRQQPITRQQTSPGAVRTNGRKTAYPLPPGSIAPRSSSMPSLTRPRVQPTTSQDNTKSLSETSMDATTPSSTVLSAPMSPVSPLGLGESSHGGVAASSMDAFFQKWSTMSSMPEVNSEYTAEMSSRSMPLSTLSTDISSPDASKRDSGQSSAIFEVYEAVIVSSYFLSESTNSISSTQGLTERLRQISIDPPSTMDLPEPAASLDSPSAARTQPEGSAPAAVLKITPAPVDKITPAPVAKITPAPITTLSPVLTTKTTPLSPSRNPSPVPAAVTTAPTPVRTLSPAPTTRSASADPMSPLSPVVASLSPTTEEKSEWRIGRESVLILPVFPQPPATLHNRRISRLDPSMPRHRPSGVFRLSGLHEGLNASSMSTDESGPRLSVGAGRTSGGSLSQANHSLAHEHLTRETYHHITSAEDVPSASRSTDTFSAARSGDLEELQLFLEQALERVQPEADPPVTAEMILDEFEPTERLPVLCCAAVARKNKYQALHMVLHAGANVESRELRIGNTPLHLICETAFFPPPPTTDFQEPTRYRPDEHGSQMGLAGDLGEPTLQILPTDDHHAGAEGGGQSSIGEVIEDADEMYADEQLALARVREDAESILTILNNEDISQEADEEGSSPMPHRLCQDGGNSNDGSGAFYKMRSQVLVKGGLEDQIRLLVLSGAPIDATNLRDETPLLMLLRYNDYVSGLATLLRLGADPTIVAPFGPGTMNHPDGGSTANMVAPKKLMRRNKTSKTSRFAMSRGGNAGAAENGNGVTSMGGSGVGGSGVGSVGGSTRHSSRLIQPTVVGDHTLVMHGSALSHAAYYLRLQCVQYLLRHEVECSDPSNIERAIQACRLSVMVEANPSMIGLQTKILHVLEHEWSGEAGRVRRNQVAERVLARRTKPARSRVITVAMLIAAGEKTSEMAPMSPTMMTVSSPLALPRSAYSSGTVRPKSAFVPSPQHSNSTGVSTAADGTMGAGGGAISAPGAPRYATSPIPIGLTGSTTRGSNTRMTFSDLPPTPTLPLPPTPTPDILKRLGSPTLGSVSPTFPGRRAGNRTSTYAFTGYDATADTDFKLAEPKAAAMESQAMELLSTTIEDEKKIVTYRWLSRSMGVNVNVAKHWMQAYLDSGKQGPISATYYLSWSDPSTGHQTVSLVSSQELEGYHIYSLEPAPLQDKELLTVSNAEARELQEGKDVNIYRCVQNNRVTRSATTIVRKPPPATTTASAVPAKAAAQPGLSGSKPGLTSVSNQADAALAPSDSNKPAAAAAPSAPAKPTKAAPSGTLANFFNRAPAKKDAEKTDSAAPSTPTPTATKLAKPRSIFDQLQAQQPKRKADEMSESNSAAMAVDKKSDAAMATATAAVETVDVEEVDSEEERDRRLARLSRKTGGATTTSKESAHPSKAAKEEMGADLEAIRRKRRSAKRLAMEDDEDDEGEDEDEDDKGIRGAATGKRRTSLMEEEDEDVVVRHDTADDEEKEAHRIALENMMLMDDDHVTPAQASAQPVDIEDEDMPMAEPEPAPKALFATTTSVDGQPGRRRGTRPVTKRKTFMNDRGYMVTKEVVEMEEFSEDEAPLPTPPPPKVPVEAPKPAARSDSTANSKGGNSKGAAAPGGGPTPTAGKKKVGGNQSLLNFFSKK